MIKSVQFFRKFSGKEWDGLVEWGKGRHRGQLKDKSQSDAQLNFLLSHCYIWRDNQAFDESYSIKEKDKDK